MLAQRANSWSTRLKEAASGQPVMVALEFATTPDCIAAYIGTLRAGLPLLLAEPGQITPDSRLAQIWQPEVRMRTTPDGLRLEAHPLPQTNAPPPAPHPDLALLLSTSGSTGDPKLVRLSAGNITSNAQSIAQYLNLTAQDCAATTLPLYYSYGMSVLNSYLAVGATLFLTERSVTEVAFWDEAATAGVTSLALVPHQFDLLEQARIMQPDHKTKPLPDLRYITQAGGKLSGRQVTRFHAIAQTQGWDLVVMYGQTEAAPRISYVPPEALATAADTIGRPIPGGRIWLADETGAPIQGSGQPGELVYEGPNVMMGYGESRPDLARGPEHTSLRTGDIAERTEDGFFRITGRLKRFVKLYGLRLSLDQIEEELRHHDIAAHAVAADDHLVLLHRHPDQGEAAALTVAEAYDLPADGICCAHLAELPLLPSGKPDQRALRARADAALARHLEDQARNRARERPSTLILRLTRTSAEADLSRSFLDLGGNSLSYLEVQMALEGRLGAVPAGWESMPLHQLDQLEPSAGGHPPKSRVGVDVILRLVAISFVVAQHASTYPLYGGAIILVMLMGYSAARFQMRLIAEGQILTLARVMLYPILPLYFLMLLTYAGLRGPVPLSYVLLYGNYHVFEQNSLLTVYWFISLYTQVVLLLMALAAIPRLRGALSRAPWKGAGVVLAALLAVQAGWVILGHNIEAQAHLVQVPWPHTVGRGLLECLPLFALGWMLQNMRSLLERGVTLALAGILLLQASALPLPPETLAYLAVAIGLLASKVEVPVSKRLGSWLHRLAAATLYVYLLHQVLVTLFYHGLGFPMAVAVPVCVVLSFVVALAAKHVVEHLEPHLLKAAHRLVPLGALGAPFGQDRTQNRVQKPSKKDA